VWICQSIIQRTTAGQSCGKWKCGCRVIIFSRPSPTATPGDNCRCDHAAAVYAPPYSAVVSAPGRGNVFAAAARNKAVRNSSKDTGPACDAAAEAAPLPPPPVPPAAADARGIFPSTCSHVSLCAGSMSACVCLTSARNTLLDSHPDRQRHQASTYQGDKSEHLCSVAVELATVGNRAIVQSCTRAAVPQHNARTSCSCPTSNRTHRRGRLSLRATQTPRTSYAYKCKCKCRYAETHAVQSLPLLSVLSCVRVCATLRERTISPWAKRTQDGQQERERDSLSIAVATHNAARIVATKSAKDTLSVGLALASTM
jgi:hypothetical protein